MPEKVVDETTIKFSQDKSQLIEEGHKASSIIEQFNNKERESPQNKEPTSRPGKLDPNRIGFLSKNKPEEPKGPVKKTDMKNGDGKWLTSIRDEELRRKASSNTSMSNDLEKERLKRELSSASQELTSRSRMLSQTREKQNILQDEMDGLRELLGMQKTIVIRAKSVDNSSGGKEDELRKEKDELKEQSVALRDRLEQLIDSDIKLEALKKQVCDLQGRLRDGQAAEDQLILVDTEKRTLLDQLELCRESHKQQVETERLNYLTELEKIQKLNDEANQCIEAKDIEISEINDEIERLTEEVRTFTTMIKENESRREDISTKKDELELQVKALDEKTKTLEESLLAKTNEAVNLGETVDSLTSAMKELRSHSEELEKMHKNGMAESETMRDEIAKLNQKLLEVVGEVKDAGSVLESQSQHIEALQKTLKKSVPEEDLSAAITKFNELKEENKVVMEGLESSLIEKDTKLGAISRELEGKILELESVTSEKEDLVKEVSVLTANSEEAMDVHNVQQMATETILKEERSRAAENQEKLAHYEERESKLSIEIEECKLDIAEQKEDIEAHVLRIADLIKEKEHLMQQYEHEKQSNANIVDTFCVLEKKVRDLVRDIIPDSQSPDTSPTRDAVSDDTAVFEIPCVNAFSKTLTSLHLNVISWKDDQKVKEQKVKIEQEEAIEMVKETITDELEKKYEEEKHIEVAKAQELFQNLETKHEKTLKSLEREKSERKEIYEAKDAIIQELYKSNKFLDEETEKRNQLLKTLEEKNNLILEQENVKEQLTKENEILTVSNSDLSDKLSLSDKRLAELEEINRSMIEKPTLSPTRYPEKLEKSKTTVVELNLLELVDGTEDSFLGSEIKGEYVGKGTRGASVSDVVKDINIARENTAAREKKLEERLIKLKSGAEDLKNREDILEARISKFREKERKLMDIVKKLRKREEELKNYKELFKEQQLRTTELA